MAVERKSSVASTREARTERELVRTMTAILPASRRALAVKLMVMARLTTGLLLSTSSSSGASMSRRDCLSFVELAVSSRGVVSLGIL